MADRQIDRQTVGEVRKQSGIQPSEPPAEAFTIYQPADPIMTVLTSPDFAHRGPPRPRRLVRAKGLELDRKKESLATQTLGGTEST
jgi:hypothetical protein